MQVPCFNLDAQILSLETEVLERIGEVCRSGQFTLGKYVDEFADQFASYCEVEHCVPVNSGTSALHLALAALEIGPGDEVITTPMTFIATSWAISYVGATPVFVDIDPVRRTLAPERVEAAITERTKAILPVHLYGQPAEMLPILQLAETHDLAVIEDCAQAHGARLFGQRVGGLGHVGCFSFYPSKNLGAWGEGGALLTRDAELADRARSLRVHAQGTRRNQHDELGFNYRMDGIQAAVLSAKLPYLEEWNQLRQRWARRYRERLAEISPLRLPADVQQAESVYHLFVVETQHRDRLAAELQAAGIGTGLHYPIPVHRQPAYAHLGLGEGSFPEAERLARECLSLPMYPELTAPHVDYVCEALTRCFEGHPERSPAAVSTLS